MITALPAFLRAHLFVPVFFGILLLAAGCKPAATPPADHATPQAEGARPLQPNTKDFAAFVQSILPPVIKLADIQIDPPVRTPNTSPASNIWLLNARITMTPSEDLLSLPSAEDAQVVNDLVNELNTLVDWRNRYANSPYAKAYGNLEIKAPVSVVPQLLVVTQPKEKPLAPIYGKVSAEWQVDHWNFQNIDLQLPSLGSARSSFSGVTMVKGSAEAERFLIAEREIIAQAKKKKEAIESHYRAELVRATQPGTTYRGQITHRLGLLACELKFMPPTGTDPQLTTFAVRLLAEPTYEFVYSAKLSMKVPVESAASADEAPIGNLIVNFVSGGGKDEAGKTLPGQMLRGLKGSYTGHDKPFILLDHRIQGIVSQYVNGDFVLTAQEAP